ncbi:hypothetical protein ACFVVM_31700 [Nocardia sp. NPDC058176]
MAGQALLTLHTDTSESFGGALAALDGAVAIEAVPGSKPGELVLGRVG